MPRWLAAVLLLFAAYVPAALWSIRSYVDRTPKGSLIIQLYPPFINEGGYSWRVASPLPKEWTRLGGAEPATIYQDDYPLLTRDSDWKTLSENGRGHFLIEGNIIMFSTSDNSDPNTNGRRYWAVLP